MGRGRRGTGGGGDETRRRGSHTDDIGVAMRDEARNNAAAAPAAAASSGGNCGTSVRMWGYLPAASPQRAPLLQPTPVPITPLNDPLKMVCNGGCGFGIAISGTHHLLFGLLETLNNYTHFLNLLLLPRSSHIDKHLNFQGFVARDASSSSLQMSYYLSNKLLVEFIIDERTICENVPESLHLFIVPTT